jgi:hypothetical protein
MPGDKKGSDGFQSDPIGADVGKGMVTDEAPVRTFMSSTLVYGRSPNDMTARSSGVTLKDDNDVERHTDTDGKALQASIRDHWDVEEAGAALEHYISYAKLRLQEPGAL